jgi:hypothetical protein
VAGVSKTSTKAGPTSASVTKVYRDGSTRVAPKKNDPKAYKKLQGSKVKKNLPETPVSFDKLSKDPHERYRQVAAVRKHA